ncbi:hypothetical protein GCM10011575_21050 [Microlunatus endophyticus]|uniref:Winged helix DNA-binding domain-containing protein n=1 Tax=Microlunatus endophyticus TaxID=1716077 RepID=A0A917S6Y0_9ACTN|nr:winged helix DNA-binding domain-containing protein [Microlunatus endophyticus]GGL62285.1 hypothetical protein GCM10011575_21050 [Microlunatus endophyticus]
MKLSAERLRAMTLARQFPAIRGRGEPQLLDLIGRLGPIQSQVPRAPFLTAASRLPGIDYPTITTAFEEHRLLKTTNLRGTVHTTVVGQFAAADSVRRPRNARELARTLHLDPTAVNALIKDLEAYCAGDWRQRSTLLDHVRRRLAERHPADPARDLGDTYSRNLVWGHSGLVRRPRDDHWESRTDSFHRTALRVLPSIPETDHDAAVRELARVHLASYGPATRHDAAWWLGVPLGTVDRAIAVLEAELVHHTGPDGTDLLDLADIPAHRSADPGLRLLPEFDGLLVGYQGGHRDRFIDHDQLDSVWARSNGLFSPTVLFHGRIVGSWRTRGPRTATIIEINPFDCRAGISDADLAPAVEATTRALDLVISDVRVLQPTDTVDP